MPRQLKIDTGLIDACVKSNTDPEPFSGVVHLARGDEVLFAQGYGFAIRAESIPNRVNTRFQTASGCKIFTAVAVCKLVDQGELEFDAPLSDCVDAEFPNYDPGITVRHLLTHSSGITSYFEEDVNPDYEALWQDLPMYRVETPWDFLPLFQHKEMKFPPGERFEYNDGGFILLGLVIESVAGMSFSQFIQEHVFDPAGMADSGYFRTDQLPGRTAYAYVRNPDGTWRTNFFAIPIVGAPDGGAYVTAPDMVRFWKALVENRLLSGEMTASLLSPQIATRGESSYTHYGYGVWVERAEEAVRKFGVEGFDPGVALKSAVYPGANVALTMMGNTSGALWSLYREIEGQLGL
jgi:CubicO group peptidase (beta-lactamase class C family)